MLAFTGLAFFGEVCLAFFFIVVFSVVWTSFFPGDLTCDTFPFTSLRGEGEATIFLVMLALVGVAVFPFVTAGDLP